MHLQHGLNFLNQAAQPQEQKKTALQSIIQGDLSPLVNAGLKDLEIRREKIEKVKKAATEFDLEDDL